MPRVGHESRCIRDGPDAGRVHHDPVGRLGPQDLGLFASASDTSSILNSQGRLSSSVPEKAQALKALPPGATNVSERWRRDCPRAPEMCSTSPSRLAFRSRRRPVQAHMWERCGFFCRGGFTRRNQTLPSPRACHADRGTFLPRSEKGLAHRRALFRPRPGWTWSSSRRFRTCWRSRGF